MFGRLLTLRLACGLMRNLSGLILIGGFEAPCFWMKAHARRAKRGGEISKACNDAHISKKSRIKYAGASTVDETS